MKDQCGHSQGNAKERFWENDIPIVRWQNTNGGQIPMSSLFNSTHENQSLGCFVYVTKEYGNQKTY